MKPRQLLRSPSRPARSATMSRSATTSTESRDERAPTQSSTRTWTWYRCAASSSAMVSLSPASSGIAPVYMKPSIRCTACGSRSVIVTSFSCCSRMLVVHMASNTGDRAASTQECARIRSSPTHTTTSESRPEASSWPSCWPRSARASGLAPCCSGTDSTREKETVIRHSTVSVSSTSQPFAGSRTLRSGMKPSACSRPSA
mmetsp:Transcript_5823/g.17207  ORF Transcript_5823/g.17207 Transcript_5823/m.17207 type:complete len:201 (+) Transcript_5823:200-802(+)